MSKKPDPKKSAKKAAPAPKAKAKPAAKPAPKVVAKPAAKAPAPKGKAAAPVKSAKAAPAPAAKKGAAPAAPAKNAKDAKAAPATKGKAAKAPKVDHAVQKGMLDKHRDVHHQSAALEVPVRAKLQFYTLADLKAHLEKRNKSKSKLNVWVPDEERKAREKAAAAARRHADHAAFCDGLVKEGRLLPGLAPVIVQTLDYVAGQEEVVEFAEGDVKKPLATALQDALKAAPQQIDFAERAADKIGAGSGGAPVDFAAPPGMDVDAAALDIHRKALAYAEAHKTDYVTAVAAVQKGA